MYRRLLLLFVLLVSTSWAGQNNITQQDWQRVIPERANLPPQVIAPSGVYTQVLSFKALEKTKYQAVQIQGTGTSPNFKVELLCSIDGITFTKPEVGGDVGTFTDANVHFCPLWGPLCREHKLRITELGGANSISIEAYEGSQ